MSQLDYNCDSLASYSLSLLWRKSKLDKMTIFHEKDEGLHKDFEDILIKEEEQVTSCKKNCEILLKYWYRIFILLTWYSVVLIIMQGL